MAKVYIEPEGFDCVNTGDWQADEKKYFKKLVGFAKENGSGDLKGYIHRVGVADGYAAFVVLHNSPLTLIHCSTLGDGYCAPTPYLRGLRVSDIKKEKKFRELLSGPR